MACCKKTQPAYSVMHLYCFTGVFIGCDIGIFSCEDFSEQQVNNFTRIVSTSNRNVRSLSHLSNPMKLIYCTDDAIYQCELDGSQPHLT